MAGGDLEQKFNRPVLPKSIKSDTTLAFMVTVIQMKQYYNNLLFLWFLLFFFGFS